MKIRNLIGAASAAVLLMSLAGCSKEDVEQAKSSVSEAADAVVEKTGDAVDAAGEMASDAADAT